MFQLMPITDALPVVTSHFEVTPADFKVVPFTPALLLSCSLDASLVEHCEFLPACAAGFEDYFEVMYVVSPDGEDETFADHLHTWDEVKSYIIRNVFPERAELAMFVLRQWEPVPLAWRAGFILGWLSALGLADVPLARQGVALLTRLVHLQHACPFVTLFSTYALSL